MDAGLASAIGTGVQGVIGIASGMIGSGKRKREQASAKKSYEQNMARFNNLDTSNVYANLQNTWEDATVNQKEAGFLMNESNKASADTMNNLSGAAGGSGIAALAQSVLGKRTSDAAQAGISIGNQETVNKNNERNMAYNIQTQKAEGELQSRQAELNKTSTLLGMSQNRLAAANEARRQATQSIMSGVGNLAGGAEKYFGGSVA